MENRAFSSHACVNHYILLLKHLSNHAFYNTGSKRLTNSSDSRQRVPLMTKKRGLR